MPTTADLLLALALTTVIEWAVAAGGFGRAGPRWAWWALVINALTNPLAHAAVYLGGSPVLPVELAVVAAEVPLYRSLLELDWRRAAALSAIGNLLSAAAGCLWA